jgi:hypothetical protein
MDKRQLMARIKRTELHAIDTDLCGITELLAERIAYISDRLDDGEISRFIDIAAAVYFLGVEEMEVRSAPPARKAERMHERVFARDFAGRGQPSGIDQHAEEYGAAS